MGGQTPPLSQTHLGHRWERGDRGWDGLWCQVMGVLVRPLLPFDFFLTGDDMVQLQFPSWCIPSMSYRTRTMLSGCKPPFPSLLVVEEVSTIRGCECLQHNFPT